MAISHLDNNYKMKRILILIFFCIQVSNIYSQSEGDTTVYDCRCREVDTIVVSPVLEFTDSIVKIIFDSVIQEERNGEYHNNFNIYRIRLQEKQSIESLEMCIEFSDLFVVWDDSLPYNYGCMYYCGSLFVLYGDYASLFFKRTEDFEKLNLKYFYISSSFPIIVDPERWWYFYYYKDKWYDIDYEKFKWRYYNYKERKWVDSE